MFEYNRFREIADNKLHKMIDVMLEISVNVMHVCNVVLYYYKSRSLDEKCRRQTAQLEMKLSLLREERRRNINRLLGRPETIDIDNNSNHNHHDEITQTESSL